MPGTRSRWIRTTLVFLKREKRTVAASSEQGGFFGSRAIREQRIDIANEVPSRMIKCVENG